MALGGDGRLGARQLQSLESEYPIRVLNRCVDVTCAHLYPDLEIEDARLRLGRSFVQGFVTTLLGRAVAVGLPMLGPVRYIKRFPDHVLMDGSPLRVTLVQLGERTFRMEFRNEFLVLSGFMAGLLLEWLKFHAFGAQQARERAVRMQAPVEEAVERRCAGHRLRGHVCATASHRPKGNGSTRAAEPCGCSPTLSRGRRECAPGRAGER